MNDIIVGIHAPWWMRVASALFILCLFGCKPKAQPLQEQSTTNQQKQLRTDQPVRMPREQAVAIAKDPITNKLGWHGNIELSSASFEDDRWFIQLWMLPKKPGSLATVEVSADGKASIPRLPR